MRIDGVEVPDLFMEDAIRGGMVLRGISREESRREATKLLKEAIELHGAEEVQRRLHGIVDK